MINPFVIYCMYYLSIYHKIISIFTDDCVKEGIVRFLDKIIEMNITTCCYSFFLFVDLTRDVINQIILVLKYIDESVANNILHTTVSGCV